MADVVKKIPWQLSSAGGNGSGGASFSLSDYQYDYALGGIPFMSATRDDWPHSEGMAEIRKQQFDNFAEPGEQSLEGWWLRSQSDFSSGAGLLYQDPDTDNQFNIRFANSVGIDPWTPGEVKLLRESVNKQTLIGGTSFTQGYVTSTGDDAAWATDGGDMYSITDSASSAVDPGTTGTVLGLASSGQRYLVGATDGVWSALGTTTGVQMYTATAGTTGTIGYVKDRIVFCLDAAVHLAPITLTPGAIPAAVYTHTDPLWQWTSVAEGPSAIYVAGTNGTTSGILKLMPTDDINVWTPSWTALMPAGEQIRTIYGYIGSFLGIATSKGFRVGEFVGEGDVAYGPLLFEVQGGCSGITGYDRFMWTGTEGQHDGVSGLYRIDLGATIQEQTTRAVRYAYASDIYGTGGTLVTSVGMFGQSNRKIFVRPGGAAFVEHATNLLPSGYLRTGRIRFNTEEPKLYKFVSIRTPNPLAGNVGLTILAQDGQTYPSITYTPTVPSGTGDVGTPQPAGRQNWIALQFTLTRGTNPALGGIMNGWQVKALPGSIRQRMITHTFLLFDEESDKGGQRMGYEGFSTDRLQQFRKLARAGDVVSFQELYDDTSSQVVIEDWKFVQLSPPGPKGGVRGGYLTAVLRTVAES